MYASIRTYRVGAGQMDALMHRVDRDFAEALAAEPGFMGYHAVDMGGDRLCTISLFAEREQADASTALAAQWVEEELQQFEVERMGAVGGEVMVSRAMSDLLVPSHH